MNINKINHENILYAFYFNVEDADEGLTFLSEDNDFIQVGLWNYHPNSLLPAHYHNEFERKSYRTCESIFVVSGKIKCNIYSKKGDFIKSFVMKEKDMAIQLFGVHEYEILEKSLVIETKNGPYFGPELDRTRVDVKKN